MQVNSRFYSQDSAAVRLCDVVKVSHVPPAGAATGSQMVQPQSPGSLLQLSTPAAVFCSSPTIMARGETSETRGVNPTQKCSPGNAGGAGGWTVCCVHAHMLPSGPTVLVALVWVGVVPLETYRLCGHGRGWRGGGRKRELGRSYQELSLVSGHSFFTARLSSVCLLKGSREYLCSAQRGWPLSTFPLLPFPITTSEAPVIYTSQDALLQLLHDGSSLHH